MKKPSTKTGVKLNKGTILTVSMKISWDTSETSAARRREVTDAIGAILEAAIPPNQREAFARQLTEQLAAMRRGQQQ